MHETTAELRLLTIQFPHGMRTAPCNKHCRRTARL